MKKLLLTLIFATYASAASTWDYSVTFIDDDYNYSGAITPVHLEWDFTTPKQITAGASTWEGASGTTYCHPSGADGCAGAMFSADKSGNLRVDFYTDVFDPFHPGTPDLVETQWSYSGITNYADGTYQQTSPNQFKSFSVSDPQTAAPEPLSSSLLLIGGPLLLGMGWIRTKGARRSGVTPK